MTTTQPDPLLETLVNDFGGNYVFALDVLDQYRHDRRSVDASWRDYFDRAHGRAPEPEPAGGGNGGERAATGAVVRQAPSPVAPVEKTKAIVLPAILPGDIAQPIRGGALRIVENMEASLQVPTATSVRTIAAVQTGTTPTW